MRTFGKVILAVGLVGLMVAPAQAQRPGGGRGFGGPGGGGGSALLTNKSVQQELKVDEAQVSKLDALAQELREKSREQFTKLQDVPEGERRAKMQELMQTSNADLRKGLVEILKPAQVKRFNQIQVQFTGLLGSATTPQVQEALKLTDDQKSKLREINQEQFQAMGEFRKSAGEDRQAAQQKMATMRRQGNEKAMALLTDSQKAAWAELTGEPFEVKFDGQGQGRPGGGQPRRKNAN